MFNYTPSIERENEVLWGNKEGFGARKPPEFLKSELQQQPKA